MLTRAYTTFTKKCGQRASPLFTVALLAVFWRAASRACTVQRGGVSAVGESQLGLRLAECWRSPLWGAQTAVRYTHLSARLCALDRIYKRIALERSTQLWDRLWPGPKTMCTQRGSQAENYPITRQQIDDILQYLEREYLGERQRTARVYHLRTSAGSTRFEPGRPRGGAPAARHGGTPAARGSGRCCNRAWRARADRGQLGQCARWQVCLR